MQSVDGDQERSQQALGWGVSRMRCGLEAARKAVGGGKWPSADRKNAPPGLRERKCAEMCTKRS